MVKALEADVIGLVDEMLDRVAERGDSTWSPISHIPFPSR